MSAAPPSSLSALLPLAVGLAAGAYLPACMQKATGKIQAVMQRRTRATQAAAMTKEQMKASAAKAKQAFLASFPAIRDEILGDAVIKAQPQTAQAWMKRVLDYNVPHGKLNRGIAVADTLAVLRGVQDANALSGKDLKDAHILGWCIELLQAFFLVADDIMDDSVTRRGQPCWYRVSDVGMVAVNDGILLEASIYKLLKNRFGNGKHPAYGSMLDVFHETTLQTATGQMLDLITAPIGKVDLSKYTMATYTNIVVYKTAFYTFFLPVACGMLLAGRTDQHAYDVARNICMKIGEYFQVQDDFLDCYGDPEVIGKIGTDIGDNKCGWLICKALTKANAEQRAVFEKNYGKPHDAAAEAAVKAVYKDLDLAADFKAYEDATERELRSLVGSQSDLPRGIFDALLDKIFRRAK